MFHDESIERLLQSIPENELHNFETDLHAYVLVIELYGDNLRYTKRQNESWEDYFYPVYTSRHGLKVKAFELKNN